MEGSCGAVARVSDLGDARQRKDAETFLSRFGRRGTTSRAEFRAEIEAAYAQMGDAVHYGAELDFDDFFGAAKASAKRGDYDEALWMYQEISEAIADHMEDVDDSDAHYGTHHDMALEGMVDCIGRLAPGYEQKRPHIAYLYDRIIPRRLRSEHTICRRPGGHMHRRAGPPVFARIAP